ncbi:hypothetical protein CVT26_001756 [Gymnopilus dilepis]|uniref:ATP-NAD kinase n=1 Tax=Gymnopilus dilepis TaxID=231916 RepID=A0A409WE63_9AGAR|nr:hypothetical protein CVT26_001756 [Gymnopilus dilepis]
MRTPPVILAIDAFLEYVSATPSWEASSHRRGTGTFTIHIQEFECSMKIGRIYLMELRYGVQVCPAMCTLSAGSNLTQRTGSPEKIDLVVTLGGDGTILHASSLFSAGAVPPVLSFSMGTLGFLLPFHIDDFDKALESVFSGKATILNRMRLACTFYDKELAKKGKDGDGEDRLVLSLDIFPEFSPDWQVMNEIALHRGSSPHLNTIDIFVDGQHLTEAVSDGLIVSTPTGSTAYSLSAGGPIVHPSLSALVLTPICPRSLSFRPLVFPSSSIITLRIGDRSRAPAGISMDGRSSHTLHPGESVVVQASPYPVPCINRSSIITSTDVENMRQSEGAGPGKEDDWVRDINNLLQYNATFRSKALLRHSRT